MAVPPQNPPATGALTAASGRFLNWHTHGLSYAHGMLCTVVEIRFHDRGCELDLQPVAADARPFMAKGSVDIAIDAALHLQPGDRVRIEGDPWSYSRPWTMLSRLERV